MNYRKIIIGIIIIVCIVSINFAIYWQFFRRDEKVQIPVEQVEEAKIIKDFNNLFNNKLNSKDDISNMNKINQTQEIIYTIYNKNESKEGTYELNVNIPAININTEKIININNQIETIFKTKAENILRNVEEKTIYSVEYTAYINSNILSLVIKSTLKEGDNPQRVIVKAYNYNLSTNEELKFSQMLEIKGLSTKSVQNQVREKIQESIKQSNQLESMGYTVYKRNIDDDMYKIENTSNYFLGANGILYIVYPYGNQNNTSEMDVLQFN